MIIMLHLHIIKTNRTIIMKPQIIYSERRLFSIQNINGEIVLEYNQDKTIGKPLYKVQANRTTLEELLSDHKNAKYIVILPGFFFPYAFSRRGLDFNTECWDNAFEAFLETLPPDSHLLQSYWYIEYVAFDENLRHLTHEDKVC